jgi:hypothetical protein
MSMILAAAYVCLQAGVNSQKLVETRQEVIQNARVAMALMSADLRCACTLAKDLEFVGTRRMLGEREADNLDFATHNYTPRRARESDWCEVSYFLDRERESGQLSLWRRRDPTPDDQPLEGGSREEIARGLLGLRFEYYDGLDWYEDWGEPEGRVKAQSSWRERPNASGLPEAVRITIWMDSNPKAQRAVAGTEAEAKSEPPLVFQTVARLNLAEASAQSASSAGSTNSPAAAQPAQTPSAGGPP